MRIYMKAKREKKKNELKAKREKKKKEYKLSN